VNGTSGTSGVNGTSGTSGTTPVNQVTGTGAAGQVAYWSSTSVITGENNLFWDATNDRLGIGLFNPSQPLEVSKSQNSDSVIQITNSNAGGSATAQFFASNGTTQTQFFHTGTAYSGLGVLSTPGTGGIYNTTAGGIALVAAGVSGIIRFATGGTTARLTIASTGEATFSNLSGTGTRMVVADANGLLSTQTIGSGSVTNVTASSPLFSSGGTTPNLTIQQASGSQNGFLSSTDWNTFNNKAPSVVGGYLPLSGGALTGPITSSSSAVFKHSGSFALKVDSASDTEENDIRFAKNGVDYGAIQTSGATNDFEFYVNNGTSWFQSIILKRDATRIDFLISNSINTTINASGLTSLAFIRTGGTSSQFLKADGTVDSNTYLTTTAAASTYLPLIGGTLTGDLTITKATIVANVVNATDTSSYSYFGNQENGVLRTYFLYLNSLWADVDRRNNLEIRNQNGPITFWANASKALTIANSGAATFSASVTSGASVTIGTGGSYVEGSIYSDSAWGMIFRAKAASPTNGEYRWANSADTELMRIATGVNGLEIGYASSQGLYKLDVNGASRIVGLAGTGTRMVVADASGVLSTQAIGSGSVTGSGTNNRVAKFTATGSVIGDSIITSASSDVRITSSVVGPMFILDNRTAAGYSQMQFEGDTKSAYIFKGNSTYTSYGGTNALNFYTDGGSGAGGFAFHPATITNAVFIDNAGNLGIGVGNAPNAKLDIAGGNVIVTNNITGGGIISVRNNNAGTSYSGLVLGNDSATTNAGGFLMLGSGFATSGRYTSNGLYIYTNRTGGITIGAESGTIKFATGTSIKGTMLANGNLGLNETNPTNLLHLAGASATPSLRLASVTVGYWYDIGRENQTTGDFLINGTYNGTSNGTLFRIHQTNFLITTKGSINVRDTSTAAAIGGAAVIGSGEFMTTGSLAGYFFENRAGGTVTSSSNWYGWYATSAIVNLYNGNANIFSIAGASGNTKVFGTLGVGRDATAPLDVYAGTGGALTFMQNTQSNGYSGIDIFRQNGTHAGSVWCANDSAGATNNRNALTIAARTGGEKVIIVGGGYDPTVTGGLTIAGSEAVLQGSNAHLQINGSTSYAYLQLTGSTGGNRNAYFIQNTTGTTSNGVSAGAAYMYFDASQQYEFVWGGTSRVQITSAGNITATAFFESSDSRLKTLIQNDYKAIGIESVKARLYTKEGKKELGYYAQDVEKILPSAISKKHDGLLNLSYRQVHTAKIAYLEKRITELEQQLKNK
jgi:hypothetical protein